MKNDTTFYKLECNGYELSDSTKSKWHCDAKSLNVMNVRGSSLTVDEREKCVVAIA
jgi:hypothetical protein